MLRSSPDDNGIELHTRLITSGWTSGSSLENAMGFLKENYTKGQKVVIYGIVMVVILL